jgi:hypothetical protein
MYRVIYYIKSLKTLIFLVKRGHELNPGTRCADTVRDQIISWEVSSCTDITVVCLLLSITIKLAGWLVDNSASD